MQATALSDSQRLYDFIVAGGLQFERVIPLDRLSEALGKSINQNRTALYKANRMLEEQEKRTLICVPRVGYRIARPNESRDIAAVRVRKSGRQVRKGLHTVVNTDTSHLTQEEKHELDLMRSGLYSVQQELRRVKRRLSKAEVRLEELAEQPKLSDAEVAFVRGLMGKAV